MHFAVRIVGMVFVALLLLAFVGSESGCDGASSANPGMVETPPPPPPGSPAWDDSYHSHKPRAKSGRTRRTR
jgi:hypothetical protein